MKLAIKRLNGNAVVIGFILCVAAALRFYRFFEIPFTYDEVSAWSRTNFTSFASLIHQGVEPDGHPALIQVLLYGVHQWFGDEEWKFKLPFLLMGVASVWLVFEIGKSWFGATAGLLTAAFVASIQFTVMYSDIARPYASGLCFVLMTVRCWSAFVIEKRRVTWLLGFVLSAALCAYNHYFSLLVAGLVGVAGLLFVNNETRGKYLLACAVAVLLFVPHVGITLRQFETGGVAWLNRPTPAFAINHLLYVFEFSTVVIIATVLVVTTGLLLRLSKRVGIQNRFNVKQNSLRVLCLVLFASPAAIGYFYSVYRSPVLQHSVLIFSFPFLPLLMFSFFPQLNWKANAALVLVLMSANVYGLVCVRDHYKVFYNQQFDLFVVKSKQATESQRDKGLLLLNESKAYTSYYLHKYNTPLPFVYWPEFSSTNPIAFEKYLDSAKADFVVACNIPNESILTIRSRYPYLIDKEEGASYSFFVFSKSPQHALPNDVILSRPVLSNDSMTFVLTNEFSPAFSEPYYNINTNVYNRVNAFVHVNNLDPESKASLVFSIEDSTRSFVWFERPLRDFIPTDSSQGNAFVTYNLRDVELGNAKPTVNIYIWNKAFETMKVDSMRVEVEKGNPLIYGLFEPVPNRCVR